MTGAVLDPEDRMISKNSHGSCPLELIISMEKKAIDQINEKAQHLYGLQNRDTCKVLDYSERKSYF